MYFSGCLSNFDSNRAISLHKTKVKTEIAQVDQPLFRKPVYLMKYQALVERGSVFPLPRIS